MTAPKSISLGHEPLTLANLDNLEAFRTALVQAGYNETTVAKTLDVKLPAENMDWPMLVRRTAEPTPFNSLFQLFMLGRPIAEAQARLALAPASVQELTNGGLLLTCPEGLRSAIKLVPHGGMFFASDFTYPARAESLATDHVLGVGPASVTLSALTVRKPGVSVFDLGCGAGVQSLIAARHSRHVVGTDISQRALNLAAFNARLNGITNVTWRYGSFFEPVQDELFDLVVANPPFVISPESEFLYRDGGMGGDAVSEFVTKGVTRKLTEGGFATVLINWHHQSEDDWEQRPRQWLAGLGCDVWVIRSGVSSPLSYAASWLRFNEGRDPERYGQLLDKWLAYYQRLGIQRISAAAVLLRKRPTASNWFRFDSADLVQGSPQCNDSLLRVFAAEDFLQGLHQDTDLLDYSFRIHPDVIVDQRLVIHDGNWASESLVLNMREGFPFSGKADVHILKLLSGCNGQRPLRHLIQSLSDGLETSVDTITPSCLVVVKKMIRSGMLLCAE